MNNTNTTPTTTTTTPQGFEFATHAAGFKKAGKPDLALLYSKTPATAAATFTTNKFRAAPVTVGAELLEQNSEFHAVLINSGQANACTGEEGIKRCRRTLELVSASLSTAGVNVTANAILPASTGVIGNQLMLEKWEAAAPILVAGLGKSTAEDFSKAIMTSDAFNKISFGSFELEGKTVRLCGIAKGAGMICPNMATMLSVLLCDAKVDSALWRKLLKQAVSLTFNRATVDGDTSTNDTVYALANGAGGAVVTEQDAPKLLEAMTNILRKLAYMLVQDGEGATKVMQINITGAPGTDDAEKAARTVGHSQLVKTAMFGQDANWGRIVAALGRSGAEFDPNKVSVTVCGVTIFKDGQPVYTASGEDDPTLVAALKQRDILIEVSLGSGSAHYELMASDLTHDYVTLNSDYRS